MLRIFLTGDNHFGRKYERYPQLKERLVESRLECFEKMVVCANENQCDIFAVAGDLFEKVSGISRKTVSRVVGSLAKFRGEVFVLPGNHDFYTGEEEVWKLFERESEGFDNIHLFKEFRECEFEVSGQRVVVYPAFCQSKHGDKNNLEWIKQLEIPQNETYRLGMAHGAIEKVTPDKKQEYFLMTEDELERIPVDVWLIGHTHVPYPRELGTDAFIDGRKIYNAGTHEQTDLSCNTEGVCFLIEVEPGRPGGEKVIRAKKVPSGRVRFYDRELKLNGNGKGAGYLEKRLRELTEGCGRESLFRVRLKGTVPEADFAARHEIYNRVFGEFYSLECLDGELCEQITERKIRNEFSELSFLYQFLMELSESADHAEEGTELQMVYDLIRECGR